MSRILVTGADGYLGRAIVRTLMDECGHGLVLWCHARDESSARLRREEMTREYPGLADRAEWCHGDLREVDPLAGIDTRDISHVVHAAAVTRFNIDEESAREVNIHGTRRVLEFASRCPNLDHLALLSSLYAAGCIEGDITEDRLPPAHGFANHYEWSKRAAEDVLSEQYPGLPASVLRIATVIADDSEGTVTHFNVVHNSLRLLFYGLLTVWPGDPAVPVYLVTRQFVARAVTAILLRAIPGSVYHLSPDPDQAISLGEMLEVVYAEFLRDIRFGSAGILKPLLSGQQAFETLADGALKFGGPVLRESIASIRPFAPQLFSKKRFHNQRLKAAIGGWSEPGSAILVRNTADFLVRTRWGLR